MAEDKNLFGMLNEISSKQDEILKEIAGLKTSSFEIDSKSAELEQKNQRIDKKPVIQPAPVDNLSKKSNLDVLQAFLRQAKKSWMWGGNSSEFKRSKVFAVFADVILLIIGLVNTIISAICFKMYSTFTFFENIWLIFIIIRLANAIKSKRIYEVNEFSRNSSTKFKRDNVGMLFPAKEKTAFRVFKWITLISIICNIVCIWTLGKELKAFSTIMEILFLGAMIFTFVMDVNLYSQYMIIYVEGHNLNTNERVVLVVPPGGNELMPEEEFKKKMPFLYD